MLIIVERRMDRVPILKDETADVKGLNIEVLKVLGSR